MVVAAKDSKTKRWLDKKATEVLLVGFFKEQSAEIREFGQTVNQAFEAFVFSSVVRWYIQNGWKTELINPPGSGTELVKLKFNTRGRPSNYTYARAEKDGERIQIRHQLRVATFHHQLIDFEDIAANICADVAVIRDVDLSRYKSDDFVSNRDLVSFGEAKHMSAFAELIANFVGLVHELAPKSLEVGQRPYIGPLPQVRHPAPFMYVSGHIQRTAHGLIQTIRARGFNIDIFDYRSSDLFGSPVPSIPAPGKGGGAAK